jgi:hypothetical protein
MYSKLGIGIDFDNTIASYDKLFLRAAQEGGLVDTNFVGGKRAVRDALLARSGGERDWMAVQGRVYGALMVGADLVEGVAEFLQRCNGAGAATFIISHKTEFGHFDAEHVNLRDAARAWMVANGFFDAAGLGLATSQVFFEATREDKLKRIAAQSCTHFIDDLEDVLREPAFPAGVERILYDPDGKAGTSGPYHVCHNWHDIGDAIFR